MNWKKELEEAIALGLGAIAGYYAGGFIPLKGLYKAIIGFLLVFAGAYISNTDAKLFVMGLGAVVMVQGLTVELVKVRL